MARKIWSRLFAAAMGSAMIALPAMAETQSSQGANSDIVVTAVRSHLSNWREAETAHVIVLSDGGEAELVRLTRNLERLHFLLSGLLGRSDAPDGMIKIRITLIGAVPEFEAMDLRNMRWQQGPYNELFLIGHYYDPRDDGDVMATTRADQRVVVEHTTVTPQTVQGIMSDVARNTPGLAPGASAELLGAIGGFAVTAGLRGPNDLPMTFGEKAMPVSAESLLYAGYAQHYLLTYFPAAYPRWYLDGFGQIFSTFAAPKDGVLEFGRVPPGAPTVMREFGPYPIKDVLDDSYLTQKPHKTGWTPIHAWALTHFLFFSDTRRPQLRQYLTARAAGADATAAAAIFGDQAQLGREMKRYFYTRKQYLRVTYDGSKIDQPLIRRLRESEAAFVKGRLELGSRVELPPVPSPDTPPAEARILNKARATALADRDKWLEGLRRDASRWSGELDAHLLLAEAECRSGNADRCLAAASRAEVLAPTDTRALAWKGMALAQLAASAPAAERPAALAAARATIVKANQADPDAVAPLLAYYASFAGTGEQPPASAIDGLQKAMEEVPSAPATRLQLATALAQRGQTAVARPVIMPVAAGPYDTPERPAARTLLGRIDTTPPAIVPAPGMPGASSSGAN